MDENSTKATLETRNPTQESCLRREMLQHSAIVASAGQIQPFDGSSLTASIAMDNIKSANFAIQPEGSNSQYDIV